MFCFFLIKNPQTINAGEGVERKETSYTVGGNVNCYSTTALRFHKKLKIELLYDPAIPLLGMVWKDTHTQVFTAVLLTIAKTWKQPEWPMAEEWIKMWYIHTVEYYSAIKKNEILPFAATRMHRETAILSEARQTQKDKYCIVQLTYRI